MVTHVGKDLGPGLDRVEVVAVQLLGLVTPACVVGGKLRLGLFEHVGMIALEPVELPLDHVVELRATADHVNSR